MDYARRRLGQSINSSTKDLLPVPRRDLLPVPTTRKHADLCMSWRTRSEGHRVKILQPSTDESCNSPRVLTTLSSSCPTASRYSREQMPATWLTRFERQIPREEEKDKRPVPVAPVRKLVQSTNEVWHHALVQRIVVRLRSVLQYLRLRSTSTEHTVHTSPL